jgi:hypothetical protein
MPGKGAAARSKSLPRERPPSPRGNFGPTHNHFEHAHFTPRAAGTPRETPRGESPRGGTPRAGTPRAPSPGVRRLDLSGTLGPPSSRGEKCICSICNCGRHHCPAQSKSEIFYDGDAPHPFATTSSDYKKHDTKQYSLSRMRPSPRHVYTPSNERFEHTTTAQSSFVWHERPSSAARSPAGMERSIKPGGSPTLLSSSFNSPDARMDLTTSYGATFVEHAIPTKSARPPTEAYSYGSPRELRSTNQLDFAGKQPPRCPATILPARPASARSGHVKYHLDMGGTWS